MICHAQSARSSRDMGQGCPSSISRNIVSEKSKQTKVKLFFSRHPWNEKFCDDAIATWTSIPLTATRIKDAASPGLSLDTFLQFLREYDVIDFSTTEFVAVRTFNNITQDNFTLPSQHRVLAPIGGFGSGLCTLREEPLLNFEGFVESLHTFATIKNPDPYLALQVRHNKFMQRIFATHTLLATKKVGVFIEKAAPTMQRRKSNVTGTFTSQRSAQGQTVQLTHT